MKSCVHTCSWFAALSAAAVLGSALGTPDSAHDEAACSERREAMPPPAKMVLTTLRTRDREVTVYAGDVLRFTVVDGDGEVLGEWLDADAFAQRFPRLSDHFVTAFAGEPWLDASATAARQRHGIAGAAP